MKTRFLGPILTIALLACAAGCGPSSSTAAGRCAEVVRIHGDLQGAVAIVGQPVESSEGRVEIRYEGTGAMNIPVEGSAVCVFAVGQAGALTLMDAAIDGRPLSGESVAGIQHQLAGGD